MDEKFLHAVWTCTDCWTVRATETEMREHAREGCDPELLAQVKEWKETIVDV